MSGVKQYQLSVQRGGGVPPAARLSAFIFDVSLIFFLLWVLSTWVPYFSDLKLKSTADIFLPFGLALGFSLFPRDREVTLTIGDDFVEKQVSMGRYTFRKRIKREECKSVSVVTLRRRNWDYPRSGVVIRKHGKLVSWFYGSVFVPVTIPYQDYEEIKAKLVKWNLPKGSLDRVLS
jgi:hypothetical protein